MDHDAGEHDAGQVDRELGGRLRGDVPISDCCGDDGVARGGNGGDRDEDPHERGGLADTNDNIPLRGEQRHHERQTGRPGR
jgi:hypothetical protein